MTASSSPKPPAGSGAAAALYLLPLFFAGCDEPLDRRLAIIDEPRLLAILAEPAEAKPGETVTYNALVASPDGPIAMPPHWAFCTAGKPPTEDNVVSPACLTDEEIVDLGTQTAISAMLPANACRVFGPEVPDVGFRPRDPDPSGGYFQPIRADVGELRAFGLSRITCNLPDAPLEVSREYRDRYAPNISPGLVELAISTRDGLGVPYDDVPANAELVLEVAWTSASVEPYVWYDRSNARLVDRVEAMRVSWYATAGELLVDATATVEGDGAPSVTTSYRAPSTPGPAWLWIVLRDSRGGIATQTIPLTIR